MDEKPEVIEEQIEETRHALAEKLDKLTGKLAGTVETVENTVENVAHTVENVTHSVENTVENVSEKVENVGETVAEATEGTVHALQNAFNLEHHAQTHPWLVVGGAVLVGYVGGRLLMPAAPRRYTGPHGAGWNYFPPPQYETGTGYRSTEQARRASSASDTGKADSGSSSGLLSGITERFGPELNALKGLALGALFGVARDMLTRSLPDAIQGQVRGVFDSATEKAGGKPIQGELTDTSEESREHEFARR